MRFLNRAPFIAFLFCFLAPFIGNSQIIKEKLKGIWFSEDGSIFIFNNVTCFHPWHGEFCPYIIKGNELVISVTSRGNSYKVEYNIITLNDTLLRIGIIDRNDMKAKEDTMSFVRPDKLPNLHAPFTTISYSSSACFGTCPVRSMDIDSSSSFLYIGEGYTHLTTLQQGFCRKSFLLWLNRLLSKCNWQSLGNNYQRGATDMSTEALAITFTNGSKFNVSDYGRFAPKKLRAVFCFLYNIASLADIGYFKSSTLYNQMHFFVANLVLARDMYDSIKYMQTFDNAHYKLPVYPKGMDEVSTQVNTSIDTSFRRKFDHYANSIYVSYTVNTNGKASITNADGIKYDIKRGLLDSVKNREFIATCLYESLTTAFEKLKLFTPGMFNGKIVSVNEYIFVPYRGY